MCVNIKGWVKSYFILCNDGCLRVCEFIVVWKSFLNVFCNRGYGGIVLGYFVLDIIVFFSIYICLVGCGCINFIF